jgi:hypothetical protein
MLWSTAQLAYVRFCFGSSEMPCVQEFDVDFVSNYEEQIGEHVPQEYYGGTVVVAGDLAEGDQASGVFGCEVELDGGEADDADSLGGETGDS